MKRFSKILVAFFFVSIIAALISCNSKQNAISQLETLYEELKNNSSEYTKDDWNAVIAQMNDIDDKLKQHQSEYTEEELKEIGRLKGLCLAQITKNSVHSFKNQLQDLMKEAEGLFEGFTTGLTDEDQ